MNIEGIESKDMSTQFIVSDSDSSESIARQLRNSQNSQLQRNSKKVESDEVRLNTGEIQPLSEYNESEGDTTSSDDDEEDEAPSIASGWETRRRQLRAEAAGEIRDIRDFKMDEPDEIVDMVALRKREMLAEAKAELVSERDLSHQAYSSRFYEEEGGEEENPERLASVARLRASLVASHVLHDSVSDAEYVSDDSVSISDDEMRAAVGGGDLTTEAAVEQGELTRAVSEEDENTGPQKGNAHLPNVGSAEVKQLSMEEEEGTRKRNTHLKSSLFNSTNSNTMFQRFGSNSVVTFGSSEKGADSAAVQNHKKELAEISTPRTKNRTSSNSNDTQTDMMGLSFSSVNMGEKNLADLLNYNDEEMSFADSTIDGTSVAKEEMGKPAEKDLAELGTTVRHAGNNAKKGLPIGMSMRGVSIGPAYVGKFDQNDLFDFDNDEMSFDDDSILSRNDDIDKDLAAKLYGEEDKTDKAVKSTTVENLNKKAVKRRGKHSPLNMSMRNMSIGPDFVPSSVLGDLFDPDDDEISFGENDDDGTSARRKGNIGIDDDKKNDVLKSVAKKEQNEDGRKNDVAGKLENKDWIANLFEEDNKINDSVATEQAHETKGDVYISDDEEAAMAWAAQSTGRRKRNSPVEKEQETMDRFSKSARTINGRQRPTIDRDFLSMSNLSVGTDYASVFGIKGESNDKEISFASYDAVKIDAAEVDVGDKKNNVSMGLAKEEQNNDYRKNDVGVGIRTDVPTSIITTSSTNTDDGLGLELAVQEPSMELSLIQMIQSLKLAMEADAEGVTEFRTSDHLEQLEILPILTWDYSDKASPKWKLEERKPRMEKLEEGKPRVGKFEPGEPRVEEAQLQIRSCSLLGDMARRLTSGIQKTFCVKPNMRRRSSREDLFGLGQESGYNPLHQEGAQYL